MLDMEILCLQRRLEGVVAADGLVFGMAVASFDDNDHWSSIVIYIYIYIVG